MLGCFGWCSAGHGREVDILIPSAHGPFPIEIKSGQTPQSEFFKNIRYMNQLTKTSRGAVLYGGDESYEREAGLHLLSWRFLARDNFEVFE